MTSDRGRLANLVVESPGIETVDNQLVGPLPDEVLALTVLAWTALFGAVSFEVFGQFGADTFTDPASIFDVQMGQIIAMLSDSERARASGR